MLKTRAKVRDHQITAHPISVVKEEIVVNNGADSSSTKHLSSVTARTANLSRKIHAVASLRFLLDKEFLPKGTSYRTSARFLGEPSLWSVELFLPDHYEDSTDFQEVGLGFLFRDRLGAQLQKGKKILILREIAPVLAEGEIISVIE